MSTDRRDLPFGSDGVRRTNHIAHSRGPRTRDLPMTPISIDRAAQAAIRRSVIGFFLGTVSALLFIVTLLEFDIGSIASSARFRSEMSRITPKVPIGRPCVSSWR